MELEYRGNFLQQTEQDNRSEAMCHASFRATMSKTTKCHPHLNSICLVLTVQKPLIFQLIHIFMQCAMVKALS